MTGEAQSEQCQPESHRVSIRLTQFRTAIRWLDVDERVADGKLGLHQPILHVVGDLMALPNRRRAICLDVAIDEPNEAGIFATAPLDHPF